MPSRNKDKVIEEKRFVKNGVEVGRKRVESQQKNVLDDDGNFRTVESKKVVERGDTSEHESKSIATQIKDAGADLVDGIKSALGVKKNNNEGEVVMRETIVKKK